MMIEMSDFNGDIISLAELTATKRIVLYVSYNF